MIEQMVLACAPLGPCQVVQAIGVEAMNALPRFTVDVLHPDASVDLASVTRSPALLTFGDEDGGARAVPLLVTRIGYRGPHRDGHRYRLELSTPAALLGLRAGYRTFQLVTTDEIVTQVLADVGISADSIEFRLGSRYKRRTYCAQYGETEWDFIERLLADEGISYWFDADEDRSRLLFGDGPGAHEPISGGGELRFEEPSGMARTSASLFELERTLEMVPERAGVVDYDARHPDRPIVGAAGSGALDYFEYPAGAPHDEAAAAQAEVRLDQLRRHAVRARGRSACARLVPGRVVTIDGATDDEINGAWLITAVRHTLEQASRNVASGRPYVNEVELVPHRDRPFRPALPHRAPRVAGVESAIVTGPSGEEIHVDDLGSIKVRFPWDRSGVSDDRSSCWVRTTQMQMHGSMLLPRVGWEVSVAYIDGDPDRPVALGRVYNGGAPPPYALPSRKAIATLQSATSPGGGTTHEIRLSDDAGSMETYIHATRNQSVSVGGSATTTVSVNATHDVKKSAILHAATQTIDVGAEQSITVGADADVTIKGSRSESIGGMERTSVIASRVVDCAGSYTEAVGGLYALQCNNAATTIQGAYAQTVGGAAVYTAGVGVHQSVAAGRVEVVGGSKVVVAGSAFTDSTNGPKKITAGAVTIDAAAAVLTHAATGSISVGGSATINAGGPIVFEAPEITIDVGGGITASGGATLKLSGKLGASGGKTTISAGTFTKKSTTKAGG